jgi:hypothetical protein
MQKKESKTGQCIVGSPRQSGYDYFWQLFGEASTFPTKSCKALALKQTLLLIKQ